LLSLHLPLGDLEVWIENKGSDKNMGGGWQVGFFWESIFNISVDEYLPESIV